MFSGLKMLFRRAVSQFRQLGFLLGSFRILTRQSECALQFQRRG